MGTKSCSIWTAWAAKRRGRYYSGLLLRVSRTLSSGLSIVLKSLLTPLHSVVRFPQCAGSQTNGNSPYTGAFQYKRQPGSTLTGTGGICIPLITGLPIWCAFNRWHLSYDVEMQQVGWGCETSSLVKQIFKISQKRNHWSHRKWKVKTYTLFPCWLRGPYAELHLCDVLHLSLLLSPCSLFLPLQVLPG